MPQVDPTVVKARAARLRAASAAQRESWLEAQIGTHQNVLVERNGIDGHAENFAPVRFAAPRTPGRIASAHIAGVENGRLIAQEAA
jgi:threonylcarbamoyladenosine tRNA methylthiotransferase MtaB